MLPVRFMKRAAKLACMIAGAAAAALAFPLPARAEESENSITLTPAQTLALYGTQITALFDYETEVTLSYAGRSSDYVGTGEYGQNIPVLSIANVSSNNQAYYKSVLNQSEFVYYSATFHNFQFSNSERLSFTLTPMLRGITGYEGQFIFSVGGSNFSATTGTRQSTVLFNTSQGVKQILTTYGNNSRMSYGRTTVQPVPSIGNPADDSIFSFGYTAALGSNSVEFAGTPQYDLQSIVFSWQSMGGITNSAVTGGYTTVYFGIQCPTLSNYVPPAVTTASTTRPQYSILPPQSTKPAQTVDLSNLESGVAAIVEQGVEANNNLNWIGSNVMVGVNNLAYIANRLDDIYNAMQQAGQVPIDSTGELMNGVQSALTSYTTAKIPTDAAAGLTFWAWLMGKITAVSFIGELAAFGAVLAVTYFILFRGRNS